MSYMVADPELMTSAASDLASIGSNVSAAHTVAAARTVAVIPAAADEVSASIAQLFSQHARDYQALAGQASAFHEQFVQHLSAGAHSYAGAEAANVALLQPSTAGFVGPIAALLGEFLNLFNTGLSQLNNLITSSLAALVSDIVRLVAGILVLALVGFFVALFLAESLFEYYGL